MKWNFLVILVTVLLVLSGCAQTPSTLPPPETPAPTPAAPSVAPTPTVPPTTPTPTPTPTVKPTPTPTTSPPDTTPPSTITGLIAGNAYDKRINLWWDKSAATDFDHYNIYLNKAEIADVTGMKAIQQLKDIATCRY
jgi:hypothetical protein